MERNAPIAVSLPFVLFLYLGIWGRHLDNLPVLFQNTKPLKHISHQRTSIGSFENFVSDFITTCSIPSFECLINIKTSAADTGDWFCVYGALVTGARTEEYVVWRQTPESCIICVNLSEGEL